MAENNRLSSQEAAARLGVRVESLYAYVSRGLLTRTRTREGSWFDPLDVEALAVKRLARRSPGTGTRGSVAGKPLMILETDVALVEDGELYLRGKRARDLATDQSIEQVASWVWGDQTPPDAPLTPPTDHDLRQTRRLLEALPAQATRVDQLTVIAVGLGSTDPLRDQPTSDALRLAGARFLLGVPALLEPAETHGANSVAQRLWRALSPHPLEPRHAEILNAALVLVLDHDLALSTLAGRVAASGRASGYAVITAALGAFASPLHGNASTASTRLLRSVAQGRSAEEAIGLTVRSTGGAVPGFGHFLYPVGDSRAEALLELVAELPEGGTATRAVHALAEVMSARTELRPNVDMALAALVLGSGMADGDGPLIFGLGRSVGWIAHAIAEHDQRPLRLRPQGRYTGP